MKNKLPNEMNLICVCLTAYVQSFISEAKQIVAHCLE